MMSAQEILDQLRKENQLLQGENSHLRQALAELQSKLAEPEEVIRAIRQGDIDALVVHDEGEDLPEIYTVQRYDSVYRTIAEECFPYGVWLAKPNGTLLYVTPSFLHAAQTSLEAMREKGQFHFLPQGIRETVEQAWEHSQQTGQQLNTEYTLRMQDGSERTIWTQGLLTQTHDGLPHWVGVNIDITEQKQTRDALRHEAEALRLSEERFRLMADSVPQFVWVTRPDGTPEYFNQRWYDYIGCPETDSQSSDWTHALHPEDRQRTLECWQLACQTGEPFEIEYRFRSRQGNYRWFLGRALPMRDTSGQIVRWCGTCTDIEDAKQAAEITQKRSYQLRRLADVATQITAAQDVSHLLEVVTREARHVIGAHQAITSLTSEPERGRTLRAVSFSDKYATWPSSSTWPGGAGLAALACRSHLPMRMTQAELEAHPAWKRTDREDSHHLPMRGWLAVPLVGRDGRTIGLIQLSDKSEGEFTQDDESVVVQLAQLASVAVENARLYDDLRRADHVKDEFLATLAHELRNPLAPIRNALHVMKMKCPPIAELEWCRDVINRQVSQMARLLDDLLDVSRITRRKLELRRERVSLAQIVESALEISRPVVEAGQHTLDVSLPDEQIYVDADPIRMAQVFANLLNNAAKYTPQGGHIQLSIELSDGTVVVTIEDNGIGIEPEHIPGLFATFSQVQSALERSQGGLGIGLSLVKGLVQLHGGTVEAHSEGLGSGSRFTVRLPVSPPADETGATETSPGITASLDQCRVLVVDDNVDAATTLAMILRLTGHEVAVVHDGQSAVDLTLSFRPDVILMDIGMPRMNGYEACRLIRQQPGGDDIILVALTGWGQEKDKLRAREEGFDEHLTKPPNLEEIQRILRARRALSTSTPISNDM